MQQQKVLAEADQVFKALLSMQQEADDAAELESMSSGNPAEFEGGTPPSIPCPPACRRCMCESFACTSGAVVNGHAKLGACKARPADVSASSSE